MLYWISFFIIIIKWQNHTSKSIGTIAPLMCASERDSGRCQVLFENSKLFGIWVDGNTQTSTVHGHLQA